MPAIESVFVQIRTGNLTDAGTDGEVYLGICGREFRLDSSGNNFERGAVDTFRLGAGGNVKNGDRNDPRSPQLRTEDLDKFPVYIRFDPVGSSPDWNLGFVVVQLGAEFGAILNPGLWLGRVSGKFCYLRAGKFSE